MTRVLAKGVALSKAMHEFVDELTSTTKPLADIGMFQIVSETGCAIFGCSVKETRGREETVATMTQAMHDDEFDNPDWVKALDTMMEAVDRRIAFENSVPNFNLFEEFDNEQMEEEMPESTRIDAEVSSCGLDDISTAFVVTNDKALDFVSENEPCAANVDQPESSVQNEGGGVDKKTTTTVVKETVKTVSKTKVGGPKVVADAKAVDKPTTPMVVKDKVNAVSKAKVADPKVVATAEAADNISKAKVVGQTVDATAKTGTKGRAMTKRGKSVCV